MNIIGKGITLAMLAGLATAAPAVAKNPETTQKHVSEGVRIDHLGVNNTLVRITGDGKYLLLPVQEANDDAKINVIIDGKVDQTIYVRLAKSKVDYYVPFDLEQYKGKDVLFNIVTSQGRQNVREAKNDACWKNITVADTFDTTNREKYRPMYHHTPLYGWMNDPNGMFYKDGVWHLYYQYNPYGSKWQNMTWGHSTSTDLINWKHEPLAILPNALGAAFSGSSVLDPKNTAGFGEDAVVTLYTTADASQTQSLAWSKDNGETFEFYSLNPVIATQTEARDPNMFWNEKTGEWNLVLAHALDHEMLVFTSPDLKEWTLTDAFGKGLGAQGGVWECPDLFELKVDGSGKKKWMLICNINPGGPFGGSATQYFIGDFDGKKFKADFDSFGNVPTKWMDFGKDHYATVSWSDTPAARRTVLGWMSNWQYAAEVPTEQFRSANTLPRDLSLFRHTDGQIYVKTVPSPEVDALRDRLATKAGKTVIDATARNFALPVDNEGICEIVMTINARKAEDVTLTLKNDDGENVEMIFNPKYKSFSFDRTESGVVDFSEDFPAVTKAPVFSNKSVLTLRIFIDRSSIEVFGNDGKFVMTNLVFPEKPYTTFSVESSNGKAELENLEIYTLKTPHAAE